MEEKLVIFDKYPNSVDANIIRGALEASGIPAGVLGDSTANAIWMAPMPVVVFEHDLENAIRAIYGGEMRYEDYQDEMGISEFENLRDCNQVFCELALKIHPQLGGKQYRDLYTQARTALDACDLKTLNKIKEALE